MSILEWTLVSLMALLCVWALGVLALLTLGRHSEARALAEFIPDCAVLVRRLLGDPRVPRTRKAILAVLIMYLLMPIDLVPDFVPVAGQLDDVIVAALALRLVLRSGGPDLLREHWPGPAGSLAVVLHVAYGREDG